jgi:acetyl-CoA synthetase
MTRRTSCSPFRVTCKSTSRRLSGLGRRRIRPSTSGHRISTTEVESALVSHPAVAEAAVVGATDPTTGQAIVAFVTVKGSVADDAEAGEKLISDLREHVAQQIGKIARPRQILVTPDLPKTRSGKIMRRLLRDVAEHRELGDVTTLADPTVVNMIDEKLRSAADTEET